MAKRSNYVNKSKRVDVVLESEEEQESPGFSSEPETVSLVLLKDMNLNYKGPITGKMYSWSGAGSVRDDINVEDAEIMLAKRGGQCCPGGSGPQPYFAKEG
jgi:hypothetical protein